MPHDIQQDTWKQLAGNAAAKLVEDGMFIGLGTGSTAIFFIYALAQRVQAGLRITGAVATSQTSSDLAKNLGLPVMDLDIHPELDLYVDGADEIDPQLNLIKGAGGALLHEKIVATAARRFVVIADKTKQVPYLGYHVPVPVEVVAFARPLVHRQLAALGASVQVRLLGERVFITESNNIILDCVFPKGIPDPHALNAQMRAITGVVETGLFLDMADEVLVGGPDGVQVFS